ncbi:hypothetical protein ACFVUH_08055 [Kitasatospora sp. NPDC058032]|uniref:hypothetical protein n=1 Tax=Kitasatospora sp. NPDC058032 TaxID=3346307 RepID=UPI0036D9BAD7
MTLRYIEVPNEFEPDGRASVFLAGETIGCPDWQSEAVGLLADAGFDGTVLSPRPSRNPASDPYAAWLPGGWQDRNIRRTDVVLFWRPIGHVRIHDCYEAHLFSPYGGAVAVGCDPAEAAQRATRARLAQLMPWLPVAGTLADTVTAALAALAAPAPTRG